jgi:hypothetical protein
VRKGWAQMPEKSGMDAPFCVLAPLGATTWLKADGPAAAAKTAANVANKKKSRCCMFISFSYW